MFTLFSKTVSTAQVIECYKKERSWMENR